MSPNQKNESGTNCWLTGPIKSAAVFSNEGNLKTIQKVFNKGLGGASINFMKCFPLIIKKKKKKRKKERKKRKEKKTKNAESMDRSCKFEGVVSQKLERT